MRFFVLVIAMVVSGCVAPERATTPKPANESISKPTNFSVDPSFPHGDAVMALMRKLFPKTKYISLSDVSLSEDATHDYAEFFVGRGIDFGFESIYYRYFIFAKKKTEDWSMARVFDKGSLRGPFSGPIELLESKGWEGGEPKKPNQPSEPTPTSVTTPAAQEIAPAAVVAHL